MWCDMDPIIMTRVSYSFHMAAVVVISDWSSLKIEVRWLKIEACCRNQPNKSKLSLYKLLFSLNIPLNGCTQAARWRASVIKVSMFDVDICASSHLKEELA